jgi:hypothetical protein
VQLKTGDSHPRAILNNDSIREIFTLCNAKWYKEQEEKKVN